ERMDLPGPQREVHAVQGAHRPEVHGDARHLHRGCRGVVCAHEAPLAFAVDRRTMSSGGIFVRCGMARPSIAASSTSTTAEPSASKGWRTVVGGGAEVRERVAATKPMMVSAAGARSPRACRPWMRPRGTWSLAAKIAV